VRAVAFSRTCDPEVGEWADAVVLTREGDTPADLELVSGWRANGILSRSCRYGGMAEPPIKKPKARARATPATDHKLRGPDTGPVLLGRRAVVLAR